MTSKACCTVPPVVTSGYTPKGTFTEFNGMKTYVTGDRNAKTGVLIIFDIFGFFPQTQQGADIIAAAGNRLVIMPDFFFGTPMDLAYYPPDTDEKMAAIMAFIGGTANVQKALENVHKLLPKLNTAYPSVEKYAVMGHCWGGKVATLLSGASTPFKASIQTHPVMTSPNDIAKLTIPHMCLASKDEPADEIAEVAHAIDNHLNEEIKSKSVVETYDTMHHGWMAARANLEDPENAKEFERGYKQIANFLQEHLTAAL